VLNTLEPTLLDFMLATSVPDRISAELAATLTGRDHCQAILEEVEQRDLFLRALDDDRQWFRYHHLFADFLRRRLERDHPGRLSNLHSTASKWFFDHAMISDAVDHALAAGDAERAADLVESDRTNLVEHSQMSTLLGLIAKLPPELVRVRPVLHIARGWADVLLHHPPEPIQKSLAACKTTLLAQNRTDDDQVLEASLVYAVADLFADRIHNLREAASKVLARPESLRPFVAASAANVASFEALHRFEFTSARSWLEQGMPYHERTTGPFAVMYGYCFAGMAAREQLDVVAAENLFRTAQQLAYRMGGVHSYSARLAGVVLGELLYERGELDEAEHLIDESYQLGSEGGVVDFMVITYGLGARIKAARGYRDLATRRLDEGERIARSLSLPRLAARIENERVRCGLLQRDSVFTPQPLGNSTSPDGRVDGIAVATRELIEDSHIRALLRGSTAAHDPHRCDRATAGVPSVNAAVGRLPLRRGAGRQSARPRRPCGGQVRGPRIAATPVGRCTADAEHRTCHHRRPTGCLAATAQVPPQRHSRIGQFSRVVRDVPDPMAARTTWSVVSGPNPNGPACWAVRVWRNRAGRLRR
jgi:ATP/maltotriose-dependent transcriptional regulator MalT